MTKRARMSEEEVMMAGSGCGTSKRDQQLKEHNTKLQKHMEISVWMTQILPTIIKCDGSVNCVSVCVLDLKYTHFVVLPTDTES